MIPWYLSRPVLSAAPTAWLLVLGLALLAQFVWGCRFLSPAGRLRQGVGGYEQLPGDIDGSSRSELGDGDRREAADEDQATCSIVEQTTSFDIVPTIPESICGVLQAATMIFFVLLAKDEPGTRSNLSQGWSKFEWGCWYLMTGTALVNVFVRRRQLLDRYSPPAPLHISLGLILGGYLVLVLNLTLFDAFDSNSLDLSRFQASAYVAGVIVLHWLAHTSSYVDYPGMPRIASASLFEWITMRWVWPILARAIVVDRLELADCPDVPEAEEPELLCAQFMQSWQQHRSLLRGLLAVFSWHLLLVLILSVFLLVSWFIPTFAMNNFLQHLERRESQFSHDPTTVESISIGYAWCLLLLLGALLRTCAEAHACWWSKMIGNRTVTILHNVIARALMDSANPPSNAVSLAAGDARKLGDAFNSGSSSLVLPFRAVVAIAYLGQLLGWAPVAVVVLIVCLVMPINMWIAQRMKSLQRESSKATDTRLDLSAQVIQAIRLIKTQVWEDHYSSAIQAARTAELDLLARSMMWQSLMMLLATFTPLFVTIAAFGTYAFVNAGSSGSGTLPPSTTFTAIQACYLLDYPMRIVPNMYAKVVLNGTISWSRVQEFLRTAYASPAANGSLGPDSVATVHRTLAAPGRVVVEGVRVRVSDQFELHVRGKLEFPKGKLTLVAGPIASGKTTLLLTLLGELLPVDGIVHFPPPSTTSFVEQTPFLLNSTLRDNVTFGQPYDPVRFADIMHRCALAQDLAALPNGDLTILGDRGVTLSGGTRQRVALARSLYPKHATTVIADDVLSAVDAVTAAHLYTQALVPAAHVEGKTVVLVSHAVGLAASQADMVVVLKEGTVVAAGEPKQVLSDRADWTVSARDVSDTADRSQVMDQMPVTIIAENKSAGERHEEERSHGSVKWAHYNTYARAFGIGLAIFTLFGLIAVQSLQLLADVYLKDWSSGKQSAESTTNPLYFLGLVAALKLGSSLVHGVVLALCTLGSYTASCKLHKAMISHLLAFPLQWFTNNPASRVTNRLAKDLGIMDSALVADIKDFIVWLLINVFAVVAIAIASPVTLAVCTPLLAVYAWIGYVYVRASRDTRRMGNVAYSPVVQHLTELEAGGPCMRAFGQIKHFLGMTLRGLREYVRPNIWNTGTNRWFAIVGDSVISVLSFCVFLGFLVLVALNTSDGDGAAEGASRQLTEPISPWAALALNYLLMMIEGVRIVVAYWAIVEVEMSSIERVGEYLALTTEPCEGLTSVSEYPTAGPLVMRNVSVAYTKSSQGDIDDWNWVLRNVSMTVPIGKRVAIVGRTGSGKTSLFGALQRLVPCIQGQITLGGVPTSSLHLRYLREQYGCVNQDNFLFSGSLRSNLDPTGARQDGEIFNLLREFSLQLPFGMDHELTSSTAVSKGQAQLIGLLRSLLAAKVKKTRFFLCDEPTSAIDHDTDAQFWHVFRHFQAVNQREGLPVTVLMIAHRIRTLIDMDCDLVLVLDAGQIVEMGHPRDLLQHAGGRFVQLTRESGAEVEALLSQYYG